MSAGFVLKQTKGFLDVPFSKHTPVFLACAAAVLGASWLNSFAFVTPHTFTSEFLAEQAKIGNVMSVLLLLLLLLLLVLVLVLFLQERTNAPAVFLNPIMNKIPGNIRGPDDVAN
ncbi:hypothetical protein COO60DRAFT_1643301 [Scenedesmus sp. NREL 46B-D3]|nr:hypothetical protein COO60DRAFT_1643301 [Scenedesmus sp. NREL 46B-D3]